MAAGGQEFYSEEEAEEILRLASHSQPLAGNVDRDRLLSMAEELGISPEAVAEAAEQVKRKKRDAADRRQFAEFRRKSLMDRFRRFASISILLLAINLLTSREVLWAPMVIGIMAAVLASKTINSLAKSGPAFDEQLRQWRITARIGGPSSLGTPIAPKDVDGVIEEILNHTDHRAKLQVIKSLREQTGMGLKEAKDSVDSFYYARRL